MNRYDLCHNAATLTAAQKTFVNETLWPVLHQVGQMYARLGARGNLYLGGSLGLRQPSVVVEGDHPVALKSDLDFFYLVQTLPPTAEDQAFLSALASLPTELDVSVHVMPWVDLDGSPLTPAYDDLMSSLDRPVCQGFVLSKPTRAKTFEDKTIASMAIGWLAACVMDYYISTHQYANTEASKVESDSGTPFKAGDIFLRVPCYGELGDSYSRRKVLDLAQKGYFEGVCTLLVVQEILTRREQVDRSASPNRWSVEQLYTRATARQLGLPLSSDPLTVGRAVIETYLSEPTPFDRLHGLELALALWRFAPGPDRLNFVREQAAACSYLAGGTVENLTRWLGSPEPHAASLLLSEIKSAALQAVTDRLTALVMKAYQSDLQ